MGNYRFAVLPYNPADEFVVRKKVRGVTDQLKVLGWNVFDLSAHKLLLRKRRAEEPEVLESWIQREKRMVSKGKSDRALRASIDYFENLIGGKEGLVFQLQWKDEIRQVLILR